VRKQPRRTYKQWLWDINIASNLAAMVMLNAPTRKKKKLRRMVRVLFNQQRRAFPPPKPLLLRLWDRVRPRRRMRRVGK